MLFPLAEGEGEEQAEGGFDPPMRLSIKLLFPRSLLGRSLLIILVPLVLLQAVAFTVFYGSYLDLVSRRLASAIAGEVAETIALRQRFPGD